MDFVPEESAINVENIEVRQRWRGHCSVVPWLLVAAAVGISTAIGHISLRALSCSSNWHQREGAISSHIADC